MKRDRRGRFLPAGAAGGSALESPPSQRREAPARARRGRPVAARAPEKKSAPPPPEEKEPPPQPPDRHRAAASPGARSAAEAQEEEAAEAAGVGRALSTGYCRLCHGKFSSRSLRHAFGKVPVMSESAKKQRRLDQVFFADFQRLVGVAVRQDPALPQFVCKKCHAQFYKCRSILRAFIQKVNISPAGHVKARGKNNVLQPPPPAAEGGAPSLDVIPSSPQCLHSLVMWTHRHAESCQLVPSLQRVLPSEYCRVLRAVWGCREGHDYVMSTDPDCGALLLDDASPAKPELSQSARRHVAGNGVDAHSTPPEPQARTAAGQPPASTTTPLPASATGNQDLQSEDLPSLPDAAAGAPLQEESLPQPCGPLNGSLGQLSEKPVPSSAPDERVKDEFSDLSEGDSSSEDENNKRARSSDDSFEPYPEKKVSNNRKAGSKEAKKAEEPKVRKKPGPKPGWKKKIKCEREELPTIYKCPYQGCTAVYRGADGMKKHIKEHHEEVRERPCPHPGCNKVFMIDRYLQRHVKLIHTEVRNYICDECGQTFKQRKHLSVHQMRHSGAKPLQCEICGFQCRQRASLKYHMTKHKAETELEFACDQCGKRFEKAHNLNVHMSMVHPLTQTQDKAKAAEPEQAAAPPDPLGTAEKQPVKLELSTQQEPT
ncbi:zinc finger protein 276 isoform X2 [Hemicordylus capensis]|uniref:zinc finger protein 276 isoform X2 n=1 Tax=Hemicordylus capensis TaxID=884348 RepID=UPI002304CBD0|nr:zinc finger protein 276 isoform X2 [Hemicordylus capensis]